jgi:hypothetical protein
MRAYSNRSREAAISHAEGEVVDFFHKPALCTRPSHAFEQGEQCVRQHMATHGKWVCKPLANPFCHMLTSRGSQKQHKQHKAATDMCACCLGLQPLVCECL